ncbi:type II toxin-antitoxin system prevent-host-death family antitoxin [Patescibacteria group bacterium]|nr:type II toxin-antitoxin system prevent-host-death family antitoxin [Patescibacteria group bacterium]
MSNILAISQARAKLPSLVKKASENLERFFITVNGIPKAVVISAEELESLEETAEILATSRARSSIKKGVLEAKKGKGTPLRELI